jgi:adenylate kinase
MKISELRIVFVAGMHGVGKTVFSERASQLLGVTRLSASELIAGYMGAPAAINKRVQNVKENQNALIEAIESRQLNDTRLILDGHFCVLDSSDLIQKIPIETFQGLAPVAAIVLCDDIGQIQKRLRIRDQAEFASGLLNDLQLAEIEHAEKVCSLLTIPICLAHTGEYEKALEFATRHLKGK